MANISFDPSVMTGAQNAFLQNTQGWIQGLTQDDYTSRAWLKAGVVLSSVTQPVWGGMGIIIDTPANLTTAAVQGNGVSLASTSSINGFTVFDQAINMIQTPGNTVPVSVAGQSVAFYTFGTNARIPLPLASGVISSLEGADIVQTIYWDTTNFNLTLTSSASTVALPSSVKVLNINANSKAVSYNSGTGAVTWLEGQDMALISL